MSLVTTPTIAVHAVNVGQPSLLHRRRDGTEVVSGIRKFTLPDGPVVVGRLNIAGDAQADLVNHGGVDKAIYAYPVEHRAAWQREIDYQDTESPVGENLSTAGILEDEARIGDIWAWGDVRLQISQPRWPCSKLALRVGQMDMIKRMLASGRSGWYLRVLETGTVDSREPIRVECVDPLGLTVGETFRSLNQRSSLEPDTLDRLMSHPLLAEAWKDGLRGKW